MASLTQTSIGPSRASTSLGGRLDLVRRDDTSVGMGSGVPPLRLDLLGRGLESVGAAREQRDAPPPLREGDRRGAPHSRRGTGDHDHPGRSLRSVGIISSSPCPVLARRTRPPHRANRRASARFRSSPAPGRDARAAGCRRPARARRRTAAGRRARGRGSTPGGGGWDRAGRVRVQRLRAVARHLEAVRRGDAATRIHSVIPAQRETSTCRTSTALAAHIAWKYARS